MFDLTGLRALVTGATGGIGGAILDPGDGGQFGQPKQCLDTHADATARWHAVLESTQEGFVNLHRFDIAASLQC